MLKWDKYYDDPFEQLEAQKERGKETRKRRKLLIRSAYSNLNVKAKVKPKVEVKAKADPIILTPDERLKKLLQDRYASRMYVFRSAARQRGATILEAIYQHEIFERDAGVCQICYKQVTEDNCSCDHKISISRGGQHTWDNVQTAHITCNSAKGSMS